jgi:YHS domain-containing protein
MKFFNSIGRNSVSISPVSRIFILSVLAAALMMMSACSNESDVPLTVNVTEIAINGFDPVSYFNADRPAKGTEEFEYTWKDVTYQFSSKDNLELFKSNPAKYAPQYGGYCAFAMSRGDYSRINPESYAIVNDKLYLTYNRDIKNAWLQDKENYISMADRIWQESKYNNH